MNAVAYLHPPRPPKLAPLSAFRLHPKIVLQRCGYCVAGRIRFVAKGRFIDQECAQCGGRGSIAIEA